MSGGFAGRQTKLVRLVECRRAKISRTGPLLGTALLVSGVFRGGGHHLRLCGKLDALTKLMRIKGMLGRGRHAEGRNRLPVEFRVIPRPS